MPQTPAQHLLDKIVTDALVRVLREAGYRRDKRTFRRASAECIQVVNVQASQWGSATSQRFTVNLGVFFPKVQQALAGDSPIRLGRSGPTEYQCQLRRRLGQLMPQHDDIWWDIEAGQDPSRVSKELGEAVKAFGLPWLEAMADFDAARQAVKDPLQALGFDLAAGAREETKKR